MIAACFIALVLLSYISYRHSVNKKIGEKAQERVDIASKILDLKIEELKEKGTDSHYSISIHPSYFDNSQYLIICSEMTPEQIDKALNSRNWEVRLTAIQHSNCTPQHIDKALNDEALNDED